MASPGGDLKASPGSDVKASPGGDLKASPGSDVKASPGGDVKASPGGDLKASPGSDVKASPGGDLKASPGSDVKASPGGDVKASPAVDYSAVALLPRVVEVAPSPLVVVVGAASSPPTLVETEPADIHPLLVEVAEAAPAALLLPVKVVEAEAAPATRLLVVEATEAEAAPAALLLPVELMEAEAAPAALLLMEVVVISLCHTGGRDAHGTCMSHGLLGCGEGTPLLPQLGVSLDLHWCGGRPPIGSCWGPVVSGALWGPYPELRGALRANMKVALSVEVDGLADVMPTSSISPSSVTLMEGSDITLECRTSGIPSPDVSWYLGNLVTSYQQQYNVKQHYTTLKMINVSSNDTGKTVLCIAENIVGENESSVILVVHFPPKITFLDQAVLDHHWCIPFSARGNPKPKLIWFYEGAVLNETDFIWTSIHIAFDSEHHGCLQLDSPTHLNNGQYTLLAKNDYGTDERTVSAHFMQDPCIGK
ncbi:UNVERIFIED_CONTAM: hypothetical protein FKN15_020785 [Acipenser sinensis]